jgi:pullulanase
MMLPVKRSLLGLWGLPTAVSLLSLLTLLFFLTPPLTAQTDIQNITLIGSLAEALGCESADAACPASQLLFDETHQLWLAKFELPPGEYEYTAVVNNDPAQPLSDPITLRLEATQAVTIWFVPTSGWLADNVNKLLANVPGSYQGEIGCPKTPLSTDENDWGPDCLQTILQDPDNDNIYEFRTTAIPPGSYEAKVALNQSWATNFGEGGAPGGANIPFIVTKENAEVLFSWDAESNIMTILAEGAPKGNLGEATAYWPTRDTILTPLTPEDGRVFELIISLDASLELTEEGVSGGLRYPLTLNPAGVPSAVLAKFPHLAGLTALTLPQEAIDRAPELLRGQFVFSATEADGTPIEATGLQIPGILDELYTYEGELGLLYDGDVPSLYLWAPTAQNVRLLIYADPATDPSTPDQTLPMSRDDETGVWSIRGEPAWTGQHYLYEVTVYAPRAASIVTNLVTDPYALDLSENSLKTRFTNLADPSTMPQGWLDLPKPELNRPEDIVLYELHIRDFSAYDEAVPEELRGKYVAFTLPEATGTQHLQKLAEAGVTHIHLLPAFDIATINENPAERREPSVAFLQRGGPAETMQQGAVEALKALDGFNWGYDPFHYGVPEGSYATSADDGVRVQEFRQMVQALNQNGLRVVMDVVYNHTNASGQSDKSVLDKIVPGYYHRLNSRGRVETSTCCQNNATEHNMMRKLMVDTLVLWATEYKVDGFRFDLMGHHMLEDMVAVRTALDGLTLAEHGVDGRAIYVYGEGWDFGEVADNARGVNAVQLNIAGTNLGVFNDRLRDGVRGGTPFSGEQEQGFATGLFVDPNEEESRTAVEQLAQALLYADLIRTGLAGALADYTFENAQGEMVAAREIPYGDSDDPAGYTAVPSENIIYVSAHDNETLFDALQYKLPVTTSMADRVRSQILALSFPMFSQGVPFFHAGTDMLRSKSLDRDSYDSGDWFNRLDFTYQTNNWGVGLPPASANESNWPVMRPLLANPDLQPAPEHITLTTELFQELLRIRRSSPLFRLATAEEVQAKLRFFNTGPNQIPGLIVMALDDTQGDTAVDDTFSHLVVLFNGTPDSLTFPLDELGDGFVLHPIQQASADEVVRTATFADGAFTVPSRTTAVFVQYRPGQQPDIAPVLPDQEATPEAYPVPLPDLPTAPDSYPVPPVVAAEPTAYPVPTEEASEASATSEPTPSPIPPTATPEPEQPETETPVTISPSEPSNSGLLIGLLLLAMAVIAFVIAFSRKQK